MKEDFWVEHSCGCWKIGEGDKIFPIVFKTRNMGFSVRIKIPLIEGPQDIVVALIKANAKYIIEKRKKRIMQLVYDRMMYECSDEFEAQKELNWIA